MTNSGTGPPFEAKFSILLILIPLLIPRFLESSSLYLVCDPFWPPLIKVPALPLIVSLHLAVLNVTRSFRVAMASHGVADGGT